ncbi:serine/threonine-protein kinase M1, partial [Lunasporangiospora selenospora]
HDFVRYCCEDEHEGVAPLLASFLNGKHTSVDSWRTVNKSLQEITDLAKNDSFKNVFTLYEGSSQPVSAIDKPRQKLEWLVLVTVIPALALPPFTSVQRDLVIKCLRCVHDALIAIDDDLSPYALSKSPQRSRAFCLVIIGILNEIAGFLERQDLTFPSDLAIRMSLFKTPPSQDVDPTWMSLRFNSLDEAIAVVCYLMSFLHNTVDTYGRPTIQIDQGLLYEMTNLTSSLLRTFRSSSTSTLKDRNGSSYISANLGAIYQLFQACCHCIQNYVPLQYTQRQLLPSLAKSLLLILSSHVMTIEDQFNEWNACTNTKNNFSATQPENAAQDSQSTKQSVTEFREEVKTIGAFETLLIQSLLVVMEAILKVHVDAYELLEFKPVISRLLLSDKFAHLSHDSSGMNIQRTLILLVGNLVIRGAYPDPLEAIAFILSKFVHLEPGLLIEFIFSCLNHWQYSEPEAAINDEERENTSDVAPTAASSSLKRSFDNPDHDLTLSAETGWKRTKVDNFPSSSPSVETANYSSIIAPSQLSQRATKLSQLPKEPRTARSAAMFLTTLLKKYLSDQITSYTLSHGSRVQAARSYEFLLESIESIGKYYLLWALSPGMQNPVLNQSYLESSYPLVLDLIGSIAHLPSDREFPEANSNNNDEIRDLKATAIESLAVMSTHCRNLRSTIDSVIGLVDDEYHFRTLASSIGIFFCGLAMAEHGTGPMFFFDVGTQSFRLRQACICGAMDPAQKTRSIAQESSGKPLDPSYLNAFNRLIPMCSSLDSRKVLLAGLVRTFYHIDLSNVDLRSLEFVGFVFSQLTDENEHIRHLARNVVEVIVQRIEADVNDDPFGASETDEILSLIDESITKAMTTPSPKRFTRSLLQLSRCVMRHLPEDHYTYSSLLQRMVESAAKDCMELALSEVNRGQYLFSLFLCILKAILKSKFVLQLTLVAVDKGFSNYRLLLPITEYMCVTVITRLREGDENWLQLFFAWAGLSQARFLSDNLPKLFPTLVIYQRRDLIEKVASILKESPAGLCIRLIDHILAAVFMRPGANDFSSPLEFLRSLVVQKDNESDQAMDGLSIVDLTTLSTQGLLCCVCLDLGHENKATQDRAEGVIAVIESHAWEKEKAENETNTQQTERPSLSMFLSRHILGIMSEINKAVQNSNRSVTLRTKSRHLRSLARLVKLLAPIQSSILARIFTPLMDALDIHGLRLTALRTVEKIVYTVEPIQLDTLLGYIIMTIGKVYERSNKHERHVAYDILRYLIIDCQEQLSSFLLDVGALPALESLAEMNQVLETLKRDENLEQQLYRLIKRIGNDNAELSTQSLVELREILLSKESDILQLCTAKSDTLDPIVSALIHALLSGIGRHRGIDGPVPRLAVECLGIIGAVNPARVIAPRIPLASPVNSNFNDLEESKNFVCELIERQLVGQARSIGDFQSESQLAFTLQTLLSFCEITKEVLNAEAPSNSSSRTISSQRTPYSQVFSPSNNLTPNGTLRRGAKTARDRWRAFPRHVQEVLELFIDAQYTRSDSAAAEFPSPLYPICKTFKEWVTHWTQCLISKVEGRYAKEIFQACKHIVAYDTSTCLYILPHLVLNVLIEGSEKDQQDIVNEMATVLGNGRHWKETSSDQSFTLQNQPASELNQLGSQAVFALSDHITKWIQWRRNTGTKSSVLRSHAPASEQSQVAMKQQPDAVLGNIQAHLASISHNVIAMAAFRCKAYARALLHHEQHIRNLRQSPSLGELELQAMYEKYQEIYLNLDEPDGIEGISGLITSGSMNQGLLFCESAGRWDEALEYYQLGINSEPGHLDNYIGLYKSYESLGQFDALSARVNSDIRSNPQWEQRLSDYRIGSAWKLQEWDYLEMALSRSTIESFESGVGQLMVDMRYNRAQEFNEHLQQVRSMLIGPLAAASMESYSRAYDLVVKLHMLRELEVAFNSWDSSSGSSLAQANVRMGLSDDAVYIERLRVCESRLAQRLECMVPTFRVREQVLRLRRIAFYDIWNSGSDRMAFRAILAAEKLENLSAIIEKAKWFFSHQDESYALQTIDSALRRALANSTTFGDGLASSTRGVNGLSRSASSTVSTRLRQSSTSGPRTLASVNTSLRRAQDWELDKNDLGYIRAKAILLRTRWMDQHNLVSPNEIIEGFRQATVECESWEKGYYFLGQYYFKLFDSTRRLKGKSPNFVLSTFACKLYGKTLTLGTKHLYQVLPRLLTFWLDLGQQVHIARTSQNSANLASANTEFLNVNSMMASLSSCLPEYMFLSAFPQIISRICHRNPDAFKVLQQIVVNVVLAYPDQAIWQMMSVSRSIVPERKRVCNKILESIRVAPTIGAAIVEQIKESLDLCDNLIALCMAQVPEKVPRLSLEKHFSKIYRQLKSRYIVTIPGQRSLWPTLPESSKTMASHQPFMSNLPKVNGKFKLKLSFLDEIEIMSSLQKPRKITLIGSDGLHYTFLCKPKDDLRKDTKVMEFNYLVNTLLQKNREANRRNLYIRPYAVVPLNEECGLIEWVHNTIPFRHIMQRQYKLHNIPLLPITEIKRILDHTDHVNLFVKELLPRFPPVFYQWFKDISSEPSAWFAARLRYTRTTAVMSMVGHIVGLGDRHGENLLFDDRNGDLVHVDFNCLFEQGTTFPKPERVPFRLTHNIVDAMGLSGYDGAYRLACEQALKVLRDNVESLTSVLEGFLHDPLVEWSKKKRRGQQLQQALNAAGPAGGADGLLVPDAGKTGNNTDASAGDTVDAQQSEKAQMILQVVKRKLNGLESHSSFALSVKGQVEELIQVATSSENLSKMYIGWSAYL